MKIALFLGSFNPFHNGHLEVVKTALNDFKMDKVVIVPKMQNDWEDEVIDIDKRSLIIINSLIRRKSIAFIPYTFEKDFEIYPYIIISNIEKELIPPYYTYATLHALRNKYCNDEIFILTTDETLEHIPDWMHGGKIIEDYNFLVVDKPKDSILSSYIRDMIKRGGTINECVSPNVVDLIKKYYE